MGRTDGKGRGWKKGWNAFSDGIGVVSFPTIAVSAVFGIADIYIGGAGVCEIFLVCSEQHSCLRQHAAQRRILCRVGEKNSIFDPMAHFPSLQYRYCRLSRSRVETGHCSSRRRRRSK